jgi:hypothetical protein
MNIVHKTSDSDSSEPFRLYSESNYIQAEI